MATDEEDIGDDRPSPSGSTPDAHATDSVAQRTRRALPYSAASAALRLLLALAGMVLLVRYLEPSEYGVWVLLVGLADPVNLLTAFGYRNALLRFLPAIEDRAEKRDLLWSVLGRRFALTCAISAALVLGFDGFAAHLSLAGHYFEFTIVQIGMICGVTYRYAEAALHASFEQRGVLMLDLVYNTMLVGGTIVGIALETELAFFCGVFSTAAGLRLSTAIALCVRLVGPPRIFVWMGRHRESREDRRYRRMAYLTELGTAFLGTGFDNYLLAAVSTAPEIALYAVAAKIAKQLEVLLPQRMFRRLSQTAFFTRFDQSGDEDEANAMFRFLFTTNAIVGALFAALFVAHGAWALALVFPDEYAEAFWATLLFLSFLTLSTMPMGVVAQAARRPEILVYSRVTVLLNLALGIPMASQFGATGMAGATAFSVAAKSLLEYIMLRRHLPVRLPWVAVSRCLGAAGLSAGAMIASRDWLHPVVSGAGGALIYLAAIRALGVLDDRERRIVANLAPARLAAPVQRILGVTDV